MRLDRMMDLSARSLKVKREVITKLLNEGLYPYTKRYLGTNRTHQLRRRLPARKLLSEESVEHCPRCVECLQLILERY